MTIVVEYCEAWIKLVSRNDLSDGATLNESFPEAGMDLHEEYFFLEFIGVRLIECVDAVKMGSFRSEHQQVRALDKIASALGP